MSTNIDIQQIKQHFGDNIKEDIFGAKSVGMSAILVNRFNKNINYNNQIKNFFELDNI